MISGKQKYVKKICDEYAFELHEWYHRNKDLKECETSEKWWFEIANKLCNNKYSGVKIITCLGDEILIMNALDEDWILVNDK